MQLLGYFTAVPAALCRLAERRRCEQFGFFQQSSSSPLGGAVVCCVGNNGVRASMHHTGVEAVGHGE